MGLVIVRFAPLGAAVCSQTFCNNPPRSIHGVSDPEPISKAETNRSGGIFQEVFSGFFAGQLSGLRPQTTREMPARSV